MRKLAFLVLLPVPITLAAALFLTGLFGLPFETIAQTLPPTLIFVELCFNILILRRQRTVWRKAGVRSIGPRLLTLAVLRLVSLVVVYAQIIGTLYVTGLLMGTAAEAAVITPPLLGALSETVDLGGEVSYIELLLVIVVLPIVKEVIIGGLKRLMSPRPA